MKDIIDLGDSYKFNIEDEKYKKFFLDIKTRLSLQKAKNK